MSTTTLDALLAHAAKHHEDRRDDDRRVSEEPIDGYVLNPWSGLYQETDTTYQNRLHSTQAISV
jgi:hypothetical protein